MDPSFRWDDEHGREQKNWIPACAGMTSKNDDARDMNDNRDLQTRQTIVRLLSSMASAKEINQYLKRFSQLDAKRFAVVKVGGAVLRDDLEALTSSLAFLQDVGLTPIVVHGAGPQLDEEMAAAGIVKQTVNGLRVTTPEALAIVRRVFQAQNLKLVEALQAADARATSISSGVFEADYLDREALGLVGEVKKVNLAPIEASLAAGSIPVIASLGETAGGQILNINADFAANELVKVLQPYKIVFLTGTGGLLDGDGRVIDSINLTTEYDHLMQQPWINGGMKVKIEQIKDLLDGLPLTTSVSITRPEELAKELFTHKGSGTLVRRGERVLSVTSWDELDLARMRSLIESAFGRRLMPDYFATRPLHRAYVSENYRAAVILIEAAGATYLDKFAVLDDAQGEGLGRAVWQVMRDENPRLFWRSRHGNPVNPFYYSESDGCFKQEKWKVFWYGLETFAEIERCVEFCRDLPATLKDPPAEAA
jgi:acetylglutamate kinase